MKWKKKKSEEAPVEVDEAPVEVDESVDDELIDIIAERFEEPVEDYSMELLTEPVDRKGMTCEKCNVGVYNFGSVRDDAMGVLHCTKCNHMVARYS